MKWVLPKNELPAKGQRVIVTVHVGTGRKPIQACGAYTGKYWLVDMIYSNVPTSQIMYWAPIASLPRT